jgi:hypothetical protein
MAFDVSSNPESGGVPAVSIGLGLLGSSPLLGSPPRRATHPDQLELPHPRRLGQNQSDPLMFQCWILLHGW